MDVINAMFTHLFALENDSLNYSNYPHWIPAILIRILLDVMHGILLLKKVINSCPVILIEFDLDLIGFAH